MIVCDECENEAVCKCSLCNDDLCDECKETHLKTYHEEKYDSLYNNFFTDI